MKLWCPAPDSGLSPWGIRNCGTSRDLKSMCTVAFVFSWNPKATMWRSPWMMSYTWPRHSCYPDLRLDNHQTCDWGHLRSLIHKPTCWFTTTPEWTPQWSTKLTQTTVWPTHEIVSWIIGCCYKHCVLGYRSNSYPLLVYWILSQRVSHFAHHSPVRLEGQVCCPMFKWEETEPHGSIMNCPMPNC